MSDVALRIAAVLAVMAVGGCVDLGINDEDEPTSIWHADLSPGLAYPDLSGQAGALSEVGGTAASILVEGGEPGTSFAWALALGTCEAPDRQLGPDTDYPELAFDELGTATENAVLGPRLSLDRSYHVAVRVSTTDPTLVACGDLVGELQS